MLVLFFLIAMALANLIIKERQSNTKSRHLAISRKLLSGCAIYTVRDIILQFEFKKDEKMNRSMKMKTIFAYCH